METSARPMEPEIITGNNTKTDILNTKISGGSYRGISMVRLRLE